MLQSGCFNRTKVGLKLSLEDATMMVRSVF